jgi:hypothetical protein
MDFFQSNVEHLEMQEPKLEIDSQVPGCKQLTSTTSFERIGLFEHDDFICSLAT